MAQNQQLHFKRHILVGAAGALLVWFFWLTRPEWSGEMRMWRSFGDASLILLFFKLAIGPLSRLWPGAAILQRYLRQAGIWFGVLALIHGCLIWDGWARWSISRFLGYEFIPQLNRVVRLEPGFGLANVIGMIVLFFAVVLMATSSERALKALGPSWKWLHHSANTIFYLSAVHTGYFLYIHYTVSFHKNPAPPNWFRLPFLALVAFLLMIKLLAFIKTVRKRKAV